MGGQVTTRRGQGSERLQPPSRQAAPKRSAASTSGTSAAAASRALDTAVPLGLGSGGMGIVLWLGLTVLFLRGIFASLNSLSAWIDRRETRRWQIARDRFFDAQGARPHNRASR